MVENLVGQVTPTTLKGLKATTVPYGNFENPFDISQLAVAAGANYVARWNVFNLSLIHI